MRKGKLGKAFVKYVEPIDLNDYIQKHKNSRVDIALQLTRDLYQIQQQEQPITMNSLISSTIMHYPSQEVSFKDIKLSTNYLYNYINDRGYKSYISQTP